MKKKTKKIIIYAALIVLVLIIIFEIISRTCIYCWGLGTKKIITINPHIETKLDNLLAEKNTKIVIGLEGEKVIETKEGTDNFGIPFAFSPENPNAWEITNEGCKYNVQAVNQPNYCINKGWENAAYDVHTGTSIAPFDIVKNGTGYALIKINVPKDLQPCIQRFTVEVKCNNYPENTKDYFDLQVIKKSLF